MDGMTFCFNNPSGWKQSWVKWDRQSRWLGRYFFGGLILGGRTSHHFVNKSLSSGNFLRPEVPIALWAQSSRIQLYIRLIIQYFVLNGVQKLFSSEQCKVNIWLITSLRQYCTLNICNHRRFQMISSTNWFYQSIGILWNSLINPWSNCNSFKE